VKKIAWYSLEYLTSIAFGLFSIVLIARVFGPENLGKLSYIQAVANLLIFLAVLGLEQTLLKNLAKDPKNGNQLMNAVSLHLFGTVAFAGLIYIVVLILEEGTISTEINTIMLAVILFTFFSRATGLKIYFQAISKPKIISIAAIISRLFSLSFIFFSLHEDYEYHLVILFLPIQAFINFIFLLAFFYFDKQRPTSFTPNGKEMLALVKEAMPLIGATALFPLFMQGDIVLIKYFLGNEATGVYSSAAKLIEQLVFVGHIIVLSFYSKIIELQSTNKILYKQYLTSLLRLLIVIGFVGALSVSFLSSFIIATFYGEQFKGSETILAILAWKWIFIFPAALLSRLLIIEGLAKYEFIKSVVAASLSIGLNILLIPIYGPIAAAIVSVFSYFIADLLLYKLFKQTHMLWGLIRISYLSFIYAPHKLIKADIKHVLER
jgi:O-antigen/teichoic acid export membrane protein